MEAVSSHLKDPRTKSPCRWVRYALVFAERRNKEQELLLHLRGVQFLSKNQIDNDDVLSTDAADGHGAGGSG